MNEENFKNLVVEMKQIGRAEGRKGGSNQQGRNV